MPTETERGLRGKLCGSCGGTGAMGSHWIQPAAQPRSPPPTLCHSSTLKDLKNLGISITAPQPLCAGTSLGQNKVTSEQESHR